MRLPQSCSLPDRPLWLYLIAMSEELNRHVVFLQHPDTAPWHRDHDPVGAELDHSAALLDIMEER